MSIGSDIGGAEETVDMVTVLAVIGVLVFIYIKFPDWLTSAKADFSSAFDAMLKPFNAASQSISDAAASTSTGIDTALNDYEANTPSELATTVFSGPGATLDLPATTPGLPAGYDPSTGTIDESLVYNGGQ